MKRFFKTVAWSVLGVLGALLLVALAWVASNWHDAPAQPRPAALALPKPQLPDEVNSFDALTRLHEGLPAVKEGQALHCQWRTENCFGKWTADVKALAAARAAYAAQGARCDALVGEQFEYEEKLPKFTGPGTALPAFQGLVTCANWWLSAGVLARSRGDKAAAIASLMQTDRYQRALLAGSHSLVGLMVSNSIARRSLQVFTGVALQDPTMSAALLPLLAPLPDAAAAAKRWMVVESAWQNSTITEISLLTALPEHATGDILAPLTNLLVRRGIGYHPNRTAQLADARWTRWITQLDGGLVAAIQAQRQAHADTQAQGWTAGWTWRNTAGSIMLAIAEPHFVSYLARQADLELHRELAQLAVAAQAQAIAPAQRGEWSKTQALPDHTRTRIAWSADGRVLSANTWEAEVDRSTAQNPERQTIRIEWPALNN
jgi:hypothetical protein